MLKKCELQSHLVFLFLNIGNYIGMRMHIFMNYEKTDAQCAAALRMILYTVMIYYHFLGVYGMIDAESLPV